MTRLSRIAIISDAWWPFWGGGQVHVLEIAKRQIDKFALTVDVFSPEIILEKNYVPTPKPQVSGLRSIDVGPKASVSNFLVRSMAGLNIAFRIWQEHQNKPYDLIHSHGYSSGAAAKIASILINRPVVHTVHGANFLDLKRPRSLYYIQKLLLTMIPYDREITVSESFLKYPNVNKNIQVIPNGVDIKRFSKKNDSKRPGVFKILWVGRFDRVKGLDVLIQALAMMKKEKKKFTATLVGDGPERKEIERLARKFGLKDLVVFPGPKFGESLVKEYQSADIFVLPSLSEGFPLTLLEAFASKKPVIATRVGDNENLVSEGVNGWLVKPGNVVELTQALRHAMSNRARLSKMGSSGYSLVKDNYDWDIVAGKTHDLYLEVIK